MGCGTPPTIYIYECQQLLFFGQKSLEDILNHSSVRGIFSKRACQLLPNRHGFSHTPKAVHGPVALRCLEARKIAVERKVIFFHPSVGP